MTKTCTNLWQISLPSSWLDNPFWCHSHAWTSFQLKAYILQTFLWTNVNHTGMSLSMETIKLRYYQVATLYNEKCSLHIVQRQELWIKQCLWIHNHLNECPSQHHHTMSSLVITPVLVCSNYFMKTSLMKTLELMACRQMPFPREVHQCKQQSWPQWYGTSSEKWKLKKKLDPLHLYLLPCTVAKSFAIYKIPHFVFAETSSRHKIPDSLKHYPKPVQNKFSKNTWTTPNMLQRLQYVLTSTVQTHQININTYILSARMHSYPSIRMRSGECSASN